MSSWIKQPKYDQEEFTKEIVNALSILLRRNGLKHHVIFAEQHLPSLIRSRAFGEEIQQQNTYENFSSSPFQSFFFWPSFNMIPSPSFIQSLPEDFLSRGKGECLTAKSTFVPSFKREMKEEKEEKEEEEGFFTEFVGFKKESSIALVEHEQRQEEFYRLFRTFNQGSS